jgi:hypothetical protein
MNSLPIMLDQRFEDFLTLETAALNYVHLASVYHSDLPSTLAVSPQLVRSVRIVIVNDQQSDFRMDLPDDQP